MTEHSAGQPVLKRKRISVACNSCRAKKSKCDGRRPVCGRCAGYDYHCCWGIGKSPRNESCTPRRASREPSDTESSEIIFERYNQAVRALASNLEPHHRSEVIKGLSCIQAHLFPRRSSSDATTIGSSGASGNNSPALIQRIQSPRYVGEVSDIHFFNLVKQTAAAAPAEGTQRDDGEVDNYDTEAPSTMEYLQNPLSDVPTQDQADQYLGVYFSTIHTAYPYVEEAPFRAKLEVLRASGITSYGQAGPTSPPSAPSLPSTYSLINTTTTTTTTTITHQIR